MDKIAAAFHLLRKDPCEFVIRLDRNNCLNWLPDRPYLQLMFYCWERRKLNLLNPVTYDEKLQWLKLYDRNPKYNIYVDKFLVRDYIKQTIGEQYLVPLLGVYEQVEDIPWNDLPDKFVLKCTHGSGFNIICADKSQIDVEACKSQLRTWMRINYFWHGREWPYKNLKPRIVCEKLLESDDGGSLKDYKIFCFHGKPKLIQVDLNRWTDHKRNLYNPDWKFIEATINYPNDAANVIPRPAKLELLLNLAQQVASTHPHIRTDFYYLKDRIYFGEMTFYPSCGYIKFEPESLRVEMGDWIPLHNKKLYKTNGSKLQFKVENKCRRNRDQ